VKLLNDRKGQFAAGPSHDGAVLVKAHRGQSKYGGGQDNECGFHGIFLSLFRACITISFAGYIVK